MTRFLILLWSSILLGGLTGYILGPQAHSLKPLGDIFLNLLFTFGGLVGEMLILSIYGFPPQYLMVVAAIGLLIDPPATLLNVTGNTVCSLLIARLSKPR